MAMVSKIHGVRAEKKLAKLDFDKRISAAIHNHHH
jgi:urease accessory protein